MNIEIRRANLDDILPLVSLTKTLGYEVTETVARSRLERILDSPKDYLVVATENEKVVGFIHVFIKQILEKPLTGEVTALVVAEDMQGKGVGKTLISAGEVWAKAQGCERVAVKSNVMRTGAHSFYQAVGYSTSKRQIVFEKSI